MQDPNRHTTDGPASLIVAGRTDRGLVRPFNEDTYTVAALGTPQLPQANAEEAFIIDGRPPVLIVADGVGGNISGEVASIMAADVILSYLRDRYAQGALTTTSGAGDHLIEALLSANTVLFSYAASRPQHRGMATTATIATMIGHTVVIANVGDSRAYLIRPGASRQITKDQTLVQRLVDAGRLTPEEAQNSARRNIILQALGSESAVAPDIYEETVQPDDLLLLCSDGLSNVVTLEEMERLARNTPDIPQLCTHLVSLANARGGADNITVVAARVTK